MNRQAAIAIIALMALGAAAGWLLVGTESPGGHRHELERRTTAEGRTYYTCSMHPEVRRDEPGNCPICGMKLVPVVKPVATADDGSDPTAGAGLMAEGASPAAGSAADTDAGVAVRIDPRMQQSLGIRTARVTRLVAADAPALAAPGVVAADERRSFVVESRAAGWVEQLLVRAAGEPVTRGQALAGIYAPELYAAQEEYLLALRAGGAELAAAARQRLLLLGAGEAQVERLRRTQRAERTLQLSAPSDGIVTEVLAREGAQVAPGVPLMRIADLSKVWILAEVPQAHAAALRAGAPAQATIGGVAGVFEGRVDYVYPDVEAATRTVRARLVFDNADLQLRPGMYAQVLLQAGDAAAAQGTAAARGTAPTQATDAEATAPSAPPPAPPAAPLGIPTEALIRTGTRNVVIIVGRDGSFLPVAVEPGAEQGDRVEILFGLAEGQQVVVSGQFLIDSESSLQAAFGRMESP